MSRRRPRRVVVEARAKLNLGLAVGPRRRDGFHDLATVFQSVSLADTLEVSPARSGFRLSIRFENDAVTGAPRRPRLPTGPSNLVLRAARRFAGEFGLSGGARFRLVKRIPVEAGLGGGSADAAAALVALARLHDLRPPRAALEAIAADLGSDVPFFLRGGTAVGFGRGERLRTLKTARFRAVIAVPSWSVPTGEAFARLDRARVKYGLTQWGVKLRFAQNIGRKRLSPMRAMALGNSLVDALAERARDYEDLRTRLRAAGLRDPLLTGSGSAVFGIIPPHLPADRVVGRFTGTEALYVVRPTATGLRVRRERSLEREARRQNAQAGWAVRRISRNGP